MPGAPSPRRPRVSRRVRRWLIAAGIVLLAGVMTGIWFVGLNWPFRYRKIKPLLEDVFGSEVAIAHYHRTYFPNPGFIATGLTLRRKSAPDQPPIGTVQTLFVQGRWIDLFLLRQRVELVDMTGAHVVLPPPGSRAAEEDFPPGSSSDFTGPDTAIARLEVHESVLDVLHDNGERFTFPVRLLHIENMQKASPFKYAVDMENAFPHGQLRVSGSFGPLNAQDLGKTPFSGQFTFNDVDLHDVGDIHGILSSSGRFQGRLEAIAADARALTPDFAVDDGKPTPVAGAVRCTVNGLNGDVAFQSMELRVGSTVIEAAGGVGGEPKKTTHIDLSIRGGRAEDVLRPFLHIDVPIVGPVALRAHAFLGPVEQGAGFWERLRVDGAFEVPAERLTDRATEKGLSAFSERAQGGKASEKNIGGAADAISSVEGPAIIRNAMATTHGLTFEVAGARARLDGTFNFHSEAVHLVGKLKTQADIAHDTTGFKSFLLKPLAPFFKGKRAGAVIPIAVTGTPGKYKVTQDLMHTK